MIDGLEVLSHHGSSSTHASITIGMRVSLMLRMSYSSDSMMPLNKLFLLLMMLVYFLLYILDNKGLRGFIFTFLFFILVLVFSFNTCAFIALLMQIILTVAT
jgi:hypothetical protein